MNKSHLVIIGFSQLISHKYISCFVKAIERGDIDSYSIMDVDSQQQEVNQRVQSVILKPENIFYVPDRGLEGIWAKREDFEPIFQKLIKQKGKIKVYIATEIKAHEEYLKFCIENGIDSLVEKPVLAPIENGQFNPLAIRAAMKNLIQKNKKKGGHHSVMTLSRYHKIYNNVVLNPLKKKVLALGMPLTSFHFRTAGGVWNLHKEYEEREDHPYKYGYGMLMHGAYHYIDLVTQFLNLNKLVFPNDDFTLTLSSFGAYPVDQNIRIPKKFSEAFGDYNPNWNPKVNYGETDSTTTFCLRNKTTKKVITLGTISFEQTTPSIRSWKDLSNNDYNKNGRVSSVDLEAQFSTIHSINLQCFDVPIQTNGTIERIDAFARVLTRTNASLLKNEKYNTERTFKGLFHSDSNRELISLWLKGEERRSEIDSHLLPMSVTQAIALSLQKPGYPITIDYI